MEYRVEELAQAAGVSVDTVRFYQAKGLLPPPRRQGRVALYGEGHRERLRRIRDLSGQGFRLDQIRRVLERPAAPSADRTSDGVLLEALVDESVGARTLSRRELAAEAGAPEALVTAAIASGLVEPVVIDGEERFSEADLELARTGLALLESGLPMRELLDLAVGHARHVREVADAGIDLFDDHVRRAGPASGDPEAITAAFRRLLPLVTRLVAVHFQRTLVTRALERLRRSGEDDALEQALSATREGHLEVACRWR